MLAVDAAVRRSVDAYVSRAVSAAESGRPGLTIETRATLQQMRNRVVELARVEDDRALRALLLRLARHLDGQAQRLGATPTPGQTVPLGGDTSRAGAGGMGQIMPMIGSMLPLAATRGERDASRDPRPSIAERYESRKVRGEAESLAADRYLIPEDVDVVVQNAAARWDAIVPVTAR